MSKKKPASLSGSLLSKDKAESTTGFVISLADKLKAPQDPDLGDVASFNEESLDEAADELSPEAPEGSSEPAPADPMSQEEDRRATAPDRLARQLNLKGRVQREAAPAAEATAQHLVQALRQGLTAQAEEVFGRMTGLNAGHVQRVLYGAEGRNLAIACRALGIEQLQFVSIFILSHRLGLGEKSPEPHKLTHVVTHFDQTDQKTARKILNKWLHDSSEG